MNRPITIKIFLPNYWECGSSL